MQNALKEASRQNANQVILYLSQEYTMRDIYNAFRSSLQQGRASKIHTMIIRYNNKIIKVYDLNELRNRL